MGDGCEHIGAVGRRPFNAVSVVNTAFARLVIDVKVLKIVIKVNTPRTEIAAQKRRVRGENGGDINVTFPAERYRHANLPFVEVGNYGPGELSRDVLHRSGDQHGTKKRRRVRLTSPRNQATM